MKEFGFIKVAAATPAVSVADPQSNAQRIIEQYTDADAQGAAVVVFPELALTGYTCGDLFTGSVLVEGAKAALKRVADAGRQMGAVAVIGLPMKKDGMLYNCAAVIKAGKVLGIVPKRNLSAEEKRNFISGSEGESISLFGAEVPFGTDLIFPCSDFESLALGVEIGMDLDGPVPAGTRLARAGATLIVNLSASPEYVGNESFRRLMLASQSARLNCAYLCAQAGEGESTTDLLFSGRSMIAENGEILSEREPYGEGILYADVDVSPSGISSAEEPLQGRFAVPPRSFCAGWAGRPSGSVYSPESLHSRRR